MAVNLAVLNAENFYMLMDREYTLEEFSGLSNREFKALNSSIFNPNKDLYKIEDIAKTILAEDFDFVGLCEVGGLETLENFNKHFLGGSYECFLHQNNSKRGIFVGALVKKGSFGGIQARNMEGDFSRNLLRLTLFRGGATLTVFVVHLKSQNSMDSGIDKRIAEIRRLSSLVESRNCIVLGDFNGIAIRGESQFEFDEFLELPFRDVLEAMEVPPSERFTHYYFGKVPSFNQLDYIFCSNDIEILGGGMIVDLIPANFSERSRLYSDHIFLKAEIRLSKGN